MLLVVAVACLIVAVTAILSIIESAIIYVDDLRLATILRKKPVNKADIKYVIKNKEAHLSSMVMLITLISIAGSSMIGAIAAKHFNDTGLAIFTALLTYCMLVFAKILPKLFAVQMAEPVLNHSARFVRIICFLLRPMLKMTLVWARLFRFENTQEPSRDELKGIIRHFNKSGVIEREERKMAELALKMNQKTLAALTTENGPMVWLASDSKVQDIQAFICEHSYKRYLVVCDGAVVGIVHYRHITSCLVNGRADKTVGELARQVVFLEEQSTLLDAVKAFGKARASVALLAGRNPEQTRMITAKQVYQAILQAS
ncbi:MULTISPECIES: CNNM domain-containing protein [unclassified Endozoicomonas]|uniref:CNNM domain-containing protein n=1 Tax=unclassified Endozoicomonas TaxID=2644528 RepID=UPI0021496FA0|nr:MULTISPECIES: CNNM domain-containing protein [unclassified Endozoicomonas]